jgi:hypothetical protein
MATRSCGPSSSEISVSWWKCGSDEIGRLAMVASTGDQWLIGCGIFGWRLVACTPGGCETLNRLPHGQNEPAVGNVCKSSERNCCKVPPYSCISLGVVGLFILGRTVQSGMVSEVTIASTREDHGRRSGVARPRLRDRMHAFKTLFV